MQKIVYRYHPDAHWVLVRCETSKDAGDWCQQLLQEGSGELRVVASEQTCTQDERGNNDPKEESPRYNTSKTHYKRCLRVF